MKKKHHNPHLTLHKTSQPAYPNAAGPHYFATKALNVMMAMVSGMGFISAMLFLVTIA